MMTGTVRANKFDINFQKVIVVLVFESQLAEFTYRFENIFFAIFGFIICPPIYIMKESRIYV